MRKTEVIPVINCAEFDCVADRAKKAEAFAEWAHLDVADGKFSSNVSWNEPEQWKELGSKLKLEVHLMVEQPEKTAEAWLAAGAKRLILHVETINEDLFVRIRESAEMYGAELMLAVAAEAPAERLRPYFGKASKFHVLAVCTGPAGQKFIPAALDKIRFLRRELPDATIEVDGGINPETAELAKDAGANLLAAGSYIFNSDDPNAAYEELKAI